MFLARPPIALACIRADHQRPIVMLVNVEMRNDEMVRSVSAVQVSGSGMHTESPGWVDDEIDGHLYLAKSVVSAIESTSMMAKFFECRNEAEDGHIQPLHINQAGKRTKI